MKPLHIYGPILIVTLAGCPQKSAGQNNIVNKDSTVYRLTFRDTIIYRYDTIWIKQFVYSDTVRKSSVDAIKETPVKRRGLNPNSWGIGPSVGAYYSPFNGFDLNIGLGVQYYLFTVPSFRNPHMGRRRGRKF